MISASEVRKMTLTSRARNESLTSRRKRKRKNFNVLDYLQLRWIEIKIKSAANRGEYKANSPFNGNWTIRRSVADKLIEHGFYPYSSIVTW